MALPVPDHDGDTSLVERLAALFEFLPGPSMSGGRWTATQISDRTAELGPVAVGKSYLSQLRSGWARHPSVWSMEALARAFEVDIAFFTNAFHDRYVSLPMRERVQLARYCWADAEREAVATDILQLPDAQQHAVFALVDILASRGH